MKKNKFKKELKKEIQDKSFQYLNELRKSKLSKLNYTKYKIQSYLTSTKLTNEEKSLLFSLRTRMVRVKDNFKNEFGNNNLSCSLQCGQYEDQQHLLNCDILIQNCEALYNDTSVKYEDLFGTEKNQLEAVRLYAKILKTRNLLLDEIATSDPGPVHQPSAVD